MPPPEDEQHAPAQPAVELPIRPPLPARIAGTALAAFGALAMTGSIGTSLARQQWLAALVAALFWAVWLTAAIRTVRLGVLIDPEGRLVVRNTWRTRTFRPEEVADVRAPRHGLASLARSGTLELVLTDRSSVWMDATARLPGRHRTSSARRTAILAALDRAE